MKTKFLTAFVFVLFPMISFADDGNSPGESDNVPEATPTSRLLPGEEVTTRSGKKMRVWDSSGPVPVTTQPQQQFNGNVGVWIDPREVQRPLAPNTFPQNK